MANTLKFGNGEWYGKKDTILAYNDENYNYKPLPFSFERASSGTVVNKAGLIETVGSGEPRIDYKDDSKGALLLEPTRSNLITYSEAFDNSYWTKSGSSVTSGFTSPKGDLSAFKLVENTSNSLHYIYSSGISVSAVKNNFSAFVKSAGKTKLAIRESSGTGRYASFDLTNKSVIQQNGTDAKIEELINGWFRISFNDVTTTSTVMGLFLLDDSYTSGSPTTSYQGDGTSGVYIYGAQAEASYATSYIPTQGSAVTRLADACSQTVPENIVNEDEMTLYCEFEYLGGGDTIPISVHNSSSSVIWLAINNNFTIYGANYYSGAFNGSSTSTTVLLPNTKYKVAYRTKSGDSVLYIDGILEASSNNAISNPNTLNKVELGSFWNGTNQNPNLKIIDAKCYNSGLSNSELQQLTTI